MFGRVFFRSDHNRGFDPAAEPAGACGDRARHKPCVRAAVHVLDRPSERLGRELSALEAIEAFGIEEIVPGEVREDDARWPVAQDVVTQHEEFLLRAKARGPVVLNGDAELLLEPRRPRRVGRNSHGVGKRVAERGDGHFLPHGAVPKSFCVGGERKTMAHAGADRGGNEAHAHDVPVRPVVMRVDGRAQPPSVPGRVFPSLVARVVA